MDSDSDEEFQKAIAASLQTENSKLICPQKQEEIDKSIAISLQGEYDDPAESDFRCSMRLI